MGDVYERTLETIFERHIATLVFYFVCLFVRYSFLYALQRQNQTRKATFDCYHFITRVKTTQKGQKWTDSTVDDSYCHHTHPFSYLDAFADSGNEGYTLDQARYN